MGYCIMRFSKVKSASSLVAIERHSKERNRLKNRLHPEREGENRIWIPTCYDSDSTMVERFHQRTEGMTVRKNAVLALEFIFAYSPEAEGTFDFNQWAKVNLEWLSKNFGGLENIISFCLHLDEKTPHCHATVVCVYENKLSAKHYVNGRVALSNLQDSYAEDMKQFCLERGRRFLDDPEIPSVRHRSLADYWHELKKDVEKTKEKIFGDVPEVRE